MVIQKSRFVLFLIALTLTAGLAFIQMEPAFAEEEGVEYQDEGISGSCHWTVDNNGVLTLSPVSGNEGTMANWKKQGPPWDGMCYNPDIKAVRIEGTIHLRTARSLFVDRYDLRDIQLKGLDTTGVKDMSRMFLNCNAVRTLDLSMLNTSAATNMDSMFFGCSQLKKLDLHHFKTSKVTNMYLMFGYCNELERIDLSGCNTSRVKRMTWMFADCFNLRYVKFGNWSYKSNKYGTTFATLMKDKKTKKVYSDEDKIPAGKNRVFVNAIPMTNLKSLKPSGTSLKVTWTKKSKIKGYQIQYSLHDDFTKAKKLTVKKPKAGSATIKSLKPGKTYYLRVRTIKRVRMKGYDIPIYENYYSPWSKVYKQEM